MRAVADRAGVSVMTVSRALRNDPCVRKEQREKIERIANDLGYRPNAFLGRYLSITKQTRAETSGNVVALLHCRDRTRDETGDGLHGEEALGEHLPWEFLKNHAQTMRLKVEVFPVENSKASVAQVFRILRARGIRAVLVLPGHEPHAMESFCFDPFVAVSLGFGNIGEDLNRVGTDIMTGFRHLTACYLARGCRRIGLAITHKEDVKVNHGFSSGLLRFHKEIPAGDRVPALWLKDDPGRAADVARFTEWFRSTRPDLVIGDENRLRAWMDAAAIPEKQRPLLVSPDWAPGQTVAGLNHRRDLACRFAVDMLTTGLISNQTGVPANAISMLVSAELAGI